MGIRDENPCYRPSIILTFKAILKINKTILNITGDTLSKTSYLVINHIQSSNGTGPCVCTDFRQAPTNFITLMVSSLVTLISHLPAKVGL